MSLYSEFQILDPGDVLIRVAGEVAGQQAAAAVQGEVQRVRRSDGSLVSADVAGFTREKHSPLGNLGGLLAFEEISLSVWAERGFGMTQRRSASSEIKRIWREQGLGAAVNWVLANAKQRPNVDGLKHLLEENARSPMGDLEMGFRRNFAKDLQKWVSERRTTNSSTAAAQAGASAAPAWYPDPTGGPNLRWWDGQRWTEHHAPR